jgi:hypothetical protein
MSKTFSLALQVPNPNVRGNKKIEISAVLRSSGELGPNPERDRRKIQIINRFADLSP